MFREDFIKIFQYLKGLIQKTWRLFLHKEPHEEDKGQWVQVLLGEVSSWHRIFFNFFFLTVETITWTTSTGGTVESPLLKIFKMQAGRMLDNLIQAPLYSQKVGPDNLLRSVPTWAVLWFCDSMTLWFNVNKPPNHWGFSNWIVTER